MMRIMEDLTRPFTDDPVQSDMDMLESYLFIQVLEEQASLDLPLVARVFDEVDPEIARTVRSVAEDESKHIRWCDPVVEHFAADEAELRRERRRFRRIARLAYHRHNLLGADYSFKSGLVAGGEPARWFWLALIGSHYLAWGLWLKLVMGRRAPPVPLSLSGEVSPPGLTAAA
jgi:hypothetical protein